MKFQAIALTLAVIMLIPGGFPAGREEGITTVLLELPDGRVFWGSGMENETQILTSICEENSLEYHLGNGTRVEGFSLEMYGWTGGSWKRGEKSDVVAFSSGVPVATPENRYPRFSPYSQLTYYSSGPTELWNFTSGAGLLRGIDSTPVGFGEYVIFESWSGLYVLKNGTLLWKNDSTKGFSTPYVKNNTIYVGSSDGFLYAFSLDGKLVFRFRVSNSPGYTGVSSSPIVVGDTVYIGGFEADNSSAKLYALTSNGTELWNVSLNSTVYYGTPAYYNGTLFVPLAGKYNASSGSWYPDFGIAAVKDGKILWKYRTSQPVKSTPIVRENSIIFTCTDGYVYRLSLDGTLLWRTRIGYSTSSPNYYNSTIFVGSGSFSSPGNIYAIDMQGHVLWNRSFAGGIQGSISVAPPFILFTVNEERGGVYCLKMDGEEVWNFTTGNYVLSSPSIVNQVLYFGDDNGTLHALADTKAPKIKFEGAQFYKYGDEVDIVVMASDNVGVRNLTVHAGDEIISGVDSAHIQMVANFTGEMEITALAEDYDGNVATSSYSVFSYNRSLHIQAEIGEEYEENETVSTVIWVTDEDGNYVDGASVSVYMDGKEISEGRTVAGMYTFALRVPRGEHTLKIVAKKEGYAQAELTKEVRGVEKSEKPGGVDMGTAGLVLGLILGISLLALAFAILLRERERKYREITRERMKDRK